MRLACIDELALEFDSVPTASASTVTDQHRWCRYRKTLNFMVMENIFHAGEYGVVKPNAVYLFRTRFKINEQID